MTRPHDPVCPHRGAPRFAQSPVISPSYRNRLARAPYPPPPPPPEPPAPVLQDFTTFIEVDVPANRLTVAAHLITALAVDRHETCQVYKDLGADYFGPSFEHLITTTCDHTAGRTDPHAISAVWALGNTINDLRGWQLLNSEAVSLHWHHDPAGILMWLQNWKTGATDNHSFGHAGQTFLVYATLERTAPNTLDARLYSNEARTAVIDILTIAIDPADTYSHVYGFNSWNDGTEWREFFGTSRDLYI